MPHDHVVPRLPQDVEVEQEPPVREVATAHRERLDVVVAEQVLADDERPDKGREGAHGELGKDPDVRHHPSRRSHDAIEARRCRARDDRKAGPTPSNRSAQPWSGRPSSG